MASKIELNHLTKDEGDTIGFVIACLFSSAIDLNEFKQWATSIVEMLNVEDIPDYIFKLLDFDEPLAGVYKAVGFAPVWNRSEKEEAALYGIAVKRGRDIFDMPISSSYALECLDENSHIKNSFNEVFPFLSDKEKGASI